MQPYRKWQRYLRVGIRAIGRWLLSTERKKIIIGRRQQAVESYGADMHCETAPPCSSFQLSVFLMFWLTCECREDGLLFQAWNERTLLVIGKRGRSVTPSERGPILLSWSTRGGREKSFVESLGLGWRVSDSNESRGGKLLGRFGSRGFRVFSGLLTSNCRGHLQPQRSHPPLRQRLFILIKFRVQQMWVSLIAPDWRYCGTFAKSVRFHRCTYITFPVDFTL